MQKYLLDTNIVIYTMKNRPQQVKRRFQKHEGEMCISAVTLGELMKGDSRLAPPAKCQQPIIYGYFGQIAYLAIHERFVV